MYTYILKFIFLVDNTFSIITHISTDSWMLNLLHTKLHTITGITHKSGGKVDNTLKRVNGITIVEK